MSIKLDKKDKDLLYELDKDSRQSYTQLAKKIKLSKGAIIYKMEKLEKEGVIKRYHTVINRKKLGYHRIRIYINLKDATPAKEEEIINYLLKNKIVTYLVSLDGEYNLGIIATVKNISEVEDLWNDLIKKYINYIEDRELSIIIKSSYFPRTYLTNLKENTSEIIEEGKADEKITSIDEKIIDLLSSNAREQIISISEKTKTNPKTIIKHIKDLRKNKIILGYRTEFDLEKIGYQKFNVGFILLKTNEEKTKTLINYAKHHPNIVAHQYVFGGLDVDLDIEVKDIRELREIIDQFRSKFSDIIHDYKILNVYKIHKKTFMPSI